MILSFVEDSHTANEFKKFTDSCMNGTGYGVGASACTHSFRNLSADRQAPNTGVLFSGRPKRAKKHIEPLVPLYRGTFCWQQ